MHAARQHVFHLQRAYLGSATNALHTLATFASTRGIGWPAWSPEWLAHGLRLCRTGRRRPPPREGYRL